MGTLYELATGQSSREGKIGERLTDTYVRRFKFIKSQPNEAYSLPAVTGIGIGSPLPGAPLVTCVSVDDSPEGESRLVRVFTYTYKTVAHTGGPVEQQQPPDVRPPNYSYNFGVDYVATTSWMPNPVANTGLTTAITPNNEMITGLEKPQLTGVLRVKQFVTADPAFANQYVGYVNSGTFTGGSFSAIARTLLFRGIDAQPAVESYQDITYSGWNVTYEFAYRENRQVINVVAGSDADVTSEVNIGWDKAVPMTSRNVLCSTAAGIGVIDPLAFPLEHNRNGAIKTVAGGPIAGKYFFAEDPNNPGVTVEGSICRAMVAIPAVKGGFTQVPAGEPVPVNNDGSPRSRSIRPLIWRRGFHKEIDFRQVLGLR